MNGKVVIWDGQKWPITVGRRKPNSRARRNGHSRHKNKGPLAILGGDEQQPTGAGIWRIWAVVNEPNFFMDDKKKGRKGRGKCAAHRKETAHRLGWAGLISNALPEHLDLALRVIGRPHRSAVGLNWLRADRLVSRRSCAA